VRTLSRRAELLPFPATLEVLKRGQSGSTFIAHRAIRAWQWPWGDRDRGYKPAANLHDQVRMAQPVSHYFYVMTHGYGAMPDYSAQLTPEDRWAVAAYIARCSLSQAATSADVPGGTQVRSERYCRSEAFARGIRRSVEAASDSHSGLSACNKEGYPAMAPQSGRPAIKIPATNRPPRRAIETGHTGRTVEI